MSKEKSLLKNTAIVTVGRVCTQLLSFLLLPLYTVYLSTEEYGVVDLLNTLISLLIPVLTFQVDQGVFRFLIDKREEKKEQNKLITTVSLFLFVQIIIYSIIFIIVNRFIHNDYKYFLLANLIVSSVANYTLQITRGFGDNKKYAIASFLSGAITIILNVALIASLKMGATGMLWATFAGQLICTIYVVVSTKLYKYIKIKAFSNEKLKEILKYSIPLIPNAISWWVVNASDRLIIYKFLDIGQNGIYSVANKFSNIITTIYGIFNITWTESASINIGQDDKNEFFSKIFRVTIEFFSALSLGLIAYMPIAFKILVNGNYIEAYNQIPILILGTFFSILVTFIGSIYVANKVTKEIAKTSIITAIINVVVNIVFINKIGLYAASLSTLIAWFTMFLYRYYDSKKYVNMKVNKMIILKIMVVTIVTFVIYYIKINWISIINAIFITFFSLYLNKNNISFIKETIKQRRRG